MIRHLKWWCCVASSEANPKATWRKDHQGLPDVVPPAGFNFDAAYKHYGWSDDEDFDPEGFLFEDAVEGGLPD